jgi:MFS family permease
VFYTAIGIPLGRIADRGSRNLMVSIGCAVWSGMTALCGLAGSFWALFAGRIGVGIGEAAMSPSAYSLLADYFPPGRLASAMSVYSLGVPVGGGLALLLGGWGIEYANGISGAGGMLSNFRPWQIVFFLVGLPGLLLAILAYLAIREPQRRHHVVAEGAGDRPSFGFVLAYMWKNRGIYAAPIMGVSFSGMLSYGAALWMSPYLQRVQGYSPQDAGLFLGLTTVFLGIPGTILAGWLADRLVARGRGDGHLLVAIGYCIAIAICGGLGPIIPVRWLSIGLIGALGFFSFTWTGVAGALLQIITPNRMRGQVSAMYLLAANIIGMGIGQTAVAMSTDHIFKRDDAVGQSLALVGIIAITLAIYFLNAGRKPIIASGLTGGGGRTIAAEQPQDAADLGLEAPAV